LLAYIQASQKKKKSHNNTKKQQAKSKKQKNNKQKPKSKKKKMQGNNNNNNLPPANNLPPQVPIFMQPTFSSPGAPINVPPWRQPAAPALTSVPRQPPPQKANQGTYFLPPNAALPSNYSAPPLPAPLPGVAVGQQQTPSRPPMFPGAAGAATANNPPPHPGASAPAQKRDWAEVLTRPWVIAAFVLFLVFFLLLVFAGSSSWLQTRTGTKGGTSNAFQTPSINWWLVGGLSVGAAVVAGVGAWLGEKYLASNNNKQLSVSPTNAGAVPAMMPIASPGPGAPPAAAANYYFSPLPPPSQPSQIPYNNYHGTAAIPMRV
jgi:hypothetical protein